MAPWIRAPAVKLDDLSSVSGIHMMKQKNGSHKLPSGLPTLSPSPNLIGSEIATWPHITETVEMVVLLSLQKEEGKRKKKENRFKYQGL